jgi:uncharacterized protein YceH (UPF0502 family)
VPAAAPVDTSAQAPAAAPVDTSGQAPAPPETSGPDGDGSLVDRIAALEAEVASLRAELDELRELYG